MTNSRGFSIIELIVVLSIIGALLAIAGISGRAWLDKYRVETQMKEMFIDLMNARVGAMQRNRIHFAVLTPTQYSVYQDTDPQPDGNGTLETASDRLLIQKNLNPLYAITYTGQINFDTRGLASPTGTLRVATAFGAAFDCITVLATRIRMGAWNGTSCVAQ